jgi:hypothetical protein
MYHATGHVDKNSHGLPYQMRSVLALLTQRNFYDDLGLTLTLGARLRVVKMQTILALDLGTTTGWAMLCDGTITSGSQSFKPQRFEGGGMRFLKFKRWLAETRYCAEWGIDAVYFEEVRRHAGVDAAHAYGGFLAHLTAWCEHHQIPYQGVPVGTIKKHATGKGNASKEDMLDAAKLRGFDAEDDNEADALALLDWAMSQGSESA